MQKPLTRIKVVEASVALRVANKAKELNVNNVYKTRLFRTQVIEVKCVQELRLIGYFYWRNRTMTTPFLAISTLKNRSLVTQKT